MERSEIRDSFSGGASYPDCASLHPGYAFCLYAIISGVSRRALS